MGRGVRIVGDLLVVVDCGLIEGDSSNAGRIRDIVIRKRFAYAHA